MAIVIAGTFLIGLTVVVVLIDEAVKKETGE